MRQSTSNPNLRKQSRQPPPINFDESGLLQHQFPDPALAMNEQPMLSRRLSQRPQLSKLDSKRNATLKKQPSARPSMASYANQDSARELLPMEGMPAEPKFQGRISAPQPLSSSRQPRHPVPPPPAVVTPPRESSDKKKHQNQERQEHHHHHLHRSKSAGKHKSRKSHRHSTSNKGRSSSHDRFEVKDVEQRHLDPVIQEHIMAEMQLAQLLQDRQMAEQVMGDDQQQMREERLRRHRDKKRNRKKGFFGRKSSHSRGRINSPDTSISSTDSFGAPPAPATANSPPPPSAGDHPSKSLGAILKSVVLPKKKKKETTKRTDNPDAPNTINDPLLQQAILESMRQANQQVVVEPPRPPARAQSDVQNRSSSSGGRNEEPRSGRRRRHSQPKNNIPADLEQQRQRQHEQHDILDSSMERLEIGMLKNQGVVAVDSLPEPHRYHPEPQKPPQKHPHDHSKHPLPDSSNRDMPLPPTSNYHHQQAPAAAPNPGSEVNEIAMMFGNNKDFLLEQQAALEALQRRQQRGERAAKAPVPAVPASNPPTASFAAATNLKKPPSDQMGHATPTTPPIGLDQMKRSEDPSSNAANTAPVAAASPAPAGNKEQVDYCGNSWDGSRSTLQVEDLDLSFLDWGSVDDEPPIREAVTTGSVVSDLTNPIASDGEYYSDSEPEDYYAENYDSEDYVDEDEWERLEKALEKGGPEAARQWEEFLKRQGVQAENEPPKHEPMEAKQSSAPYDGGYAPSQMVDDEEDVKPPAVVDKICSPSSTAVRATFVCECCAERKSIKDYSHSCDNLETPHLVCSQCIKKYLESRTAKYRVFETNKVTLYQVKCFTSLNGTSCHGCNGTLSFQLRSVFSLAELESWLVRERNRLYEMASARNLT